MCTQVLPGLDVECFQRPNPEARISQPFPERHRLYQRPPARGSRKRPRAAGIPVPRPAPGSCRCGTGNATSAARSRSASGATGRSRRHPRGPSRAERSVRSVGRLPTRRGSGRRNPDTRRHAGTTREYGNGPQAGREHAEVHQRSSCKWVARGMPSAPGTDSSLIEWCRRMVPCTQKLLSVEWCRARMVPCTQKLL